MNAAVLKLLAILLKPDDRQFRAKPSLGVECGSEWLTHSKFCKMILSRTMTFKDILKHRQSEV